MNFIDPELEAKLKPELFPGEELLWAGTPKRGIVFRLLDLYLIPFSFCWLYIVVTTMEFSPENPFSMIFFSVFYVPDYLWQWEGFFGIVCYEAKPFTE